MITKLLLVLIIFEVTSSLPTPFRLINTYNSALDKTINYKDFTYHSWEVKVGDTVGVLNLTSIQPYWDIGVYNQSPLASVCNPVTSVIVRSPRGQFSDILTFDVENSFWKFMNVSTTNIQGIRVLETNLRIRYGLCNFATSALWPKQGSGASLCGTACVCLHNEPHRVISVFINTIGQLSTRLDDGTVSLWRESFPFEDHPINSCPHTYYDRHYMTPKSPTIISQKVDLNVMVDCTTVNEDKVISRFTNDLVDAKYSHVSRSHQEVSFTTSFSNTFQWDFGLKLSEEDSSTYKAGFEKIISFSAESSHKDTIEFNTMIGSGISKTDSKTITYITEYEDTLEVTLPLNKTIEIIDRTTIKSCNLDTMNYNQIIKLYAIEENIKIESKNKLKMITDLTQQVKTTVISIV